MKLLNRTGERRIADAVIRDPAEHTVFDDRGAVRSVQAADLTMPAAELEAIWSPMHLERLARTYWKFLSRVTLGLVRVVYTPTERAVVLIGRPLVLLRFRAPEYAMDAERGIVRWRIRDGILVAAEGRDDGYLEIGVRRCPSDAPDRAGVQVAVEIVESLPAVLGVGRLLALHQHDDAMQGDQARAAHKGHIAQVEQQVARSPSV